MNKTVGILALQGAYQKHADSISKLGLRFQLVRNPIELENCDALILPGGESTTVSLLLQKKALNETIKTFADKHPVMGVCAGMILMAQEVDDVRVTPLSLIPFKALRNVYGRQVHSFTDDIKLNFDNDDFRAPFIRAPGIEKLSVDVKVLASYNEKAVMISKDKHIALTFHPELTDDLRIHQYWLRNIL